MTLIGNLEAAVRAEAAHMLRRGDINLADLLGDMIHVPGRLDNYAIIDAATARARDWEGPYRARLTGFLNNLATDLALIDLENDAAVRRAY
jgi:hypothetical protein